MLKEHLEHEVEQQLINSEVCSAHQIKVAADGSTVTLRGSVQSFREKLAAQEIAEAHPAVSVVNNLIDVESAEPIGDQALIVNIAQVLSESSELQSQSIQAEANAGKVAISGYVSTELNKKVAADIVHSVAGVSEVNNLLIVNPDRVLSNAEHSERLQVAIHRIVGMEHDRLYVSVVDENVQLTGIVDELWKKETAEKTVRQFGILTVVNDVIVRPN